MIIGIDIDDTISEISKQTDLFAKKYIEQKLIFGTKFIQ